MARAYRPPSIPKRRRRRGRPLAPQSSYPARPPAASTHTRLLPGHARAGRSRSADVAPLLQGMVAKRRSPLPLPATCPPARSTTSERKAGKIRLRSILPHPVRLAARISRPQPPARSGRRCEAGRRVNHVERQRQAPAGYFLLVWPRGHAPPTRTHKPRMMAPRWR